MITSSGARSIVARMRCAPKARTVCSSEFCSTAAGIEMASLGRPNADPFDQRRVESASCSLRGRTRPATRTGARQLSGRKPVGRPSSSRYRTIEPGAKCILRPPQKARRQGRALRVEGHICSLSLVGQARKSLVIQARGHARIVRKYRRQDRCRCGSRRTAHHG